MRTIRTISIFTSILVGMVFVIGFGPTAEKVDANPTVRGAWLATYSSSASLTNANCQLCHAGPNGGDGWNAYGWSIRQGINDQGLSATDAILAVASADPDGNNIPNLSEINGNAQPGWQTGATNSVYFKNGTIQTNQSPPSGIGLLDAGTATVPNPNIAGKIFLPYVTKQ